MAGRQTRDTGEHGARADQAGQREHLIEAGEIDTALDARMGEDCLDLGSKNEAFPDDGIEQRRDAELVAGCEQALAGLVEQDKCELAVHLVEEAVAVLFIKMDQDFDVCAGTEAVALADQVFAKRAIIENLAVTDEKQAVVLVGQWLVAGQQINNAQPTEAEPDTVLDKPAAIVGPAMRQHLRHGVDNIRRDPLVTPDAKNAANSTQIG